jgi:hypothetical protein
MYCDPSFGYPTCINLRGNAGRNILKSCHKKPERVESLISSLLSRFDRLKPRPLAGLSDIRNCKSVFG